MKVILIKGTSRQEEITILNIYAPNIGAPNYIKKNLTDLNAQIEPPTTTVIVGDLNTPTVTNK
jgi:hypothetical protein